MTKGNSTVVGMLGSLKTLNEFFIHKKIDFCLIGGLAVQFRSEPRYTRDIDVCIAADLESQEKLIDLILETFPTDILEARDLALSSQILPIIVNGITVDIAIGLSGFESQVIKRAKKEKLTQDFSLPVATSEDLIIYKILAGRAKDLMDVEGIVLQSGKSLDFAYIKSILKQFEQALSSDGFVAIFEKALNANL